jgi:hypothetical protein
MAPRPQRAPAALELVVKLQRQERPEERSGETRPRQGSRAKSRRAEQPHIGTNVALERDAAIAMVAIGRFTTNTHCKLASSMITPPRWARRSAPRAPAARGRRPAAAVQRAARRAGTRSAPPWPPAQACGTRKAITSRAVSTARTGTSRHRRARSPRGDLPVRLVERFAERVGGSFDGRHVLEEHEHRAVVRFGALRAVREVGLDVDRLGEQRADVGLASCSDRLSDVDR